MGTDGFELVEDTEPDPQLLAHAVRAPGLLGVAAIAPRIVDACTARVR